MSSLFGTTGGEEDDVVGVARGEVPPKSSNTTNRPWVERYRPKDLTQVAHQTEVVATLQNAVETGRLPHLLFYGPPGSGKTSVALALCRQLWHPSQWKSRVLELNASDERGISVVRDKIKHFASLAVGSSGGGKSNNKGFFGGAAKKKDETTASAATGMDVDDDTSSERKYPNPPFKIIILDEADTVTTDAQAALRRIIEAHSRVTRFILICNYVTRIIEPLASRCAKFRFQALPAASMKERLTTIAESEGCSADVVALLDDILDLADGDMRRAVTTLQSTHSLSVGSTQCKSSPISASVIAEIAGLPPPIVVDSLWQCMSQASSSFDAMHRGVDDVKSSGFSAQLLLSAVLNKVLSDDCTLDELSQAEVAIRIAEAEKNMIEGADEYLQLMTVSSLVLTCHQRTTMIASN